MTSASLTYACVPAPTSIDWQIKGFLSLNMIFLTMKDIAFVLKGLQSSAIIRPSFSQGSDKQAGSGKQFGTSEETQVFHEDMKEVCSDMMAKYSFSTLSNQPKRLLYFSTSSIIITRKQRSSANCVVCRFDESIAKISRRLKFFLNKRTCDIYCFAKVSSNVL